MTHPSGFGRPASITTLEPPEEYGRRLNIRPCETCAGSGYLALRNDEPHEECPDCGGGGYEKI